MSTSSSGGQGRFVVSVEAVTDGIGLRAMTSNTMDEARE